MSGADLANLLNEASGSKFSGITGSGTRTVGLPDYHMVIEIVKILMNLYSVMSCYNFLFLGAQTIVRRVL